MPVYCLVLLLLFSAFLSLVSLEAVPCNYDISFSVMVLLERISELVL